MTNKLTLAAMVLSLGALAFSCGTPMTKTDAGTGGGIGTTGGGTGTTGGGTGGGTTGGGTGRTCDTAPAFLAADLQGKAGFDPGTTTSPPFNFATLAKQTADGGVDVSFNEFYVDAPVAAVSIPAKNYQTCDYCFMISLGCNSMGAMCKRDFLAQAGTLTVGTATKSPDAGTYAFTLSNVTYEAWDFATDKPTDAGCLTLSNLSFTGTWP